MLEAVDAQPQPRAVVGLKDDHGRFGRIRQNAIDHPLDLVGQVCSLIPVTRDVLIAVSVELAELIPIGEMVKPIVRADVLTMLAEDERRVRR